MAPEISPPFADFLRRARTAAGLTQEELAEKAGISARAISNLERGVNRAPHRYTRELLADALDLSGNDRAAWASACRRAERRASSTTHEAQRPLESEHPYELPAPVTSLLGRGADIAYVAGRLRYHSVRLVTLTGPGGVGKTRLALAVADELADAYPDGVHVAGLAALRDPELVVSAIATLFNVQEIASQSLQTTLTSALAAKRLLLVLDNFEHILAAAPVVANLLASCPEISVLVTSRAPLRLRAEYDIAVPPLEVPASVKGSPEELLQSPAVELFVQRAQQVRADFALTTGNAQAVVEICRRLEGLPLAIELAAARVKLLTPQALLARLERPLSLLTDGARDAPTRQQTIRQTIVWSYELLTLDKQQLLRQLSVFVGGWTLEAAEAVCDVELEVITGLDALLDHSLVKSWEQSDGSTRFRMLETIREFAAEQLAASGEMQRLKVRHATYFVQLADEAHTALLKGPDQRRWLEQLDAELANLRAAFNWVAIHNDAAIASRLSVALEMYWLTRGYHREGRRWLETALSLSGEASSEARANVFRALGVILRELGEYDAAHQHLELGITLYSNTSNLTGLADAYTNAGGLAMYRGDYERATSLHEQALAIARAHGDLHLIARSLGALSVMAMIDGDFQRAEKYAAEFLRISDEIGDQLGRSVAMGYLGYIALWRDDIESARRWAQRCVESARKLGDLSWHVFGLELLGYIELERGEHRDAEQYFCESLRGYWTWREMMTTAECLEGLAGTAAGLGDSKRAARLLGAADSLRERVGTPLPPPRVDRYERTADATRKGLSDAAFKALRSEGYSWPLEQAIDYALEGTPASQQSVQPSAVPVAGLTKRDVEVLRLLAGGLSDREIAEHLFISHHTAMRHVSNILRKLNVDSRTAAAAWAVRNGLG